MRFDDAFGFPTGFEAFLRSGQVGLALFLGFYLFLGSFN